MADDISPPQTKHPHAAHYVVMEHAYKAYGAAMALMYGDPCDEHREVLDAAIALKVRIAKLVPESHRPVMP